VIQVQQELLEPQARKVHKVIQVQQELPVPLAQLVHKVQSV
jgi:hypothetical protein